MRGPICHVRCFSERSPAPWWKRLGMKEKRQATSAESAPHEAPAVRPIAPSPRSRGWLRTQQVSWLPDRPLRNAFPRKNAQWPRRKSSSVTVAGAAPESKRSSFFESKVVSHWLPSWAERLRPPGLEGPALRAKQWAALFEQPVATIVGTQPSSQASRQNAPTAHRASRGRCANRRDGRPWARPAWPHDAALTQSGE